MWVQESGSIRSALFCLHVKFTNVDFITEDFRFLQRPATILCFISSHLFPYSRLAVKKKEFLDNIAHLCGDDAALSDDLREELLEAAGIVLKALSAE